MIPAEHVLGVVGFQEAVAAKMAEDPLSDRVLEALQELGGEGGGFVEAEAGFWIGGILTRITLNLLEEAVHDAQVEMVVEDHADRERSLDGQVRVSALSARPARGWSTPGLQCSVGEPHGEGTALPEPGFIIRPVPYPIPGLGVLVLAALGVSHRRWLQVWSFRSFPTGRGPSLGGGFACPP